jgi:hypothetical protein
MESMGVCFAPFFCRAACSVEQWTSALILSGWLGTCRRLRQHAFPTFGNGRMCEKSKMSDHNQSHGQASRASRAFLSPKRRFWAQLSRYAVLKPHPRVADWLHAHRLLNSDDVRDIFPPVLRTYTRISGADLTSHGSGGTSRSARRMYRGLLPGHMPTTFEKSADHREE